MSLRDDLLQAIDFPMPLIRKAYEDQLGHPIDEAELTELIVNRLIPLALTLKPKEKTAVSAPSGPRIIDLSAAGESARKCFRAGEILPWPANTSVPGVAELRYIRFQREECLLKAWGPAVYDPRSITGFDPKEEICPKTRWLINCAADVMKTKGRRFRQDPEDVMSLFPRSLKMRRECARYLVFSQEMRGHDLTVTGTTTATDRKPSDRFIDTDVWWPALCALDNDASSWQFGYTEAIQGPTGQFGVAVITDGSLLIAGAVIF